MQSRRCVENLKQFLLLKKVWHPKNILTFFKFTNNLPPMFYDTLSLRRNCAKASWEKFWSENMFFQGSLGQRSVESSPLNHTCARSSLEYKRPLSFCWCDLELKQRIHNWLKISPDLHHCQYVCAKIWLPWLTCSQLINPLLMKPLWHFITLITTKINQHYLKKRCIYSLKSAI